MASSGAFSNSVRVGRSLQRKTRALTVKGDSLFPAVIPRKPVSAAGAFTMPAAHGAFTYTGQTTVLWRSRNSPAGLGTFTFTGQAVNLKHGYNVTSSVGSFNLNGQAVTFVRPRIVSAGLGSFNHNGQAVTLARSRLMSSSVGTFAFTGQVVNLLYGAAGKTLAASLGSFSLSGQVVALKIGRVVLEGLGSISVNGQAVGSVRSYRMPIYATAYVEPGWVDPGYTADPPTFSVTAQSVGLLGPPAPPEIIYNLSTGMLEIVVTSTSGLKFVINL